MRMVAPMEIGICCEDLDSLARFYGDVLGCTLVGAVDVPPAKSTEAGLGDAGYRVARLQTPYGERLKLLQPGRTPARPDTSGDFLSRRNAVYLTFIVDDLSAMLKRLAAAGTEAFTGPEPVEVRPGTFLAFARDPEGNVLEFVEYADVKAYRPDLAGA